MSRIVIIEPHYLGSLEYYIALLKADEVLLEIQDHFIKQTFRNRCYINSAAGKHPLIVPVSYDNRTKMKDVKIDYSQSWLRDHWGAICSSYGKAAFFDFFADEFQRIWDSRPAFLVDLSFKMMTICLKIAQIDRSIVFTEEYRLSKENDAWDFRNRILPKISFDQRDLYLPCHYVQNFGNNFVANLSIVDLIMCEGPGTDQILRNSMMMHDERL